MTRQLARRQRRERALGVVLAVVGVAVGVIAAFALRNPNGHGSAAAHDATETVTSSARPVTSSPAQPVTSSSARPVTSAPSSPAPSTTSTPARLALVVLNNTATTGLAEQARTRFEAGGWVVSSTGNLAADILSTCAYYDPAVAGAQASARALQAQFPTIKRVVPKFAQLPSGPVVVVLTTDYSS